MHWNYVSIPQRSDLNIIEIDFLKVDRESFNPATVWFERSGFSILLTVKGKFQSRNGLIWTAAQLVNASVMSWFQSRNGLIWTLCVLMDRVLYTMFQSRNGLIWTRKRLAEQENIDLGFNPATVWFERVLFCFEVIDSASFNPATVWFELSFIGSHTMTFSRFQSRNGLIWTL